MKLFKLLNGVTYQVVAGKDVEIKNVVIDSRRVTQGALFVCIRGMKVDGHDFIKTAYEQGASAIVIDRELDTSPYVGLNIVSVSDSREALAYIAKNFNANPSDEFSLIGVTGTNGKTSLTYFVESVLNKHYAEVGKVGVIGTVETRVGAEHVKIYYATSTTPDTLELWQIFKHMADKNVNEVVMEVTSHALALRKVVGLEFKVGVFTNLTQDHLDFHKTIDNYKETKGELFEHCETSVINIDDEHGDYMVGRAKGRVITVGINKEADIRAINISHTDKGSSFTVVLSSNCLPTIDLYNKNTFEIYVSIPGDFTVYNALCTIGVCLALNLPVATIQEALSTMKGVPGRIQSIENDKGFNVIVDYAHSPDSLENIIKSVRGFTKGKIITMFGCGGDRDREKRPIMGRISSSLSDITIITSDNPRTEQPDEIIGMIEKGVCEGARYEKVADRKLAIHRAIALAEKGDTVILAGKGHENYQIFADRTIHFDDSEIAREILSV